jgi:hypothetical protein
MAATKTTTVFMSTAEGVRYGAGAERCPLSKTLGHSSDSAISIDISLPTIQTLLNLSWILQRKTFPLPGIPHAKLLFNS